MEVKTILIFSIIAILNLEGINSLFIVLKPKSSECIKREVFTNANFAGKYYIAAENENLNRVWVLDKNDKTIWESVNKKESDFQIKVSEDTIYGLCFENNDTKFITVTFNLYEDVDHLNLVSTQTISSLNSNVHDIRKKVDIVHSDLRNSVVRRKVHVDSKIFLLFFYFKNK